MSKTWTEEGIATDPVRAGISRKQIVLAFHPADLRQLTEFARA
ncbi:MAG: element excision factor XisI family protein [Chloroflexaceae bacterium]